MEVRMDPIDLRGTVMIVNLSFSIKRQLDANKLIITGTVEVQPTIPAEQDHAS